MKVRSHLNNKQGLYDPANEHDACGVGLIVNVHGGKSHGIVESALKVLENMRHRGAEGADNKTGDGAGLLQIPHEFILLQGIPVPEKGKYGTGLVFFPKDEKQHSAILSIMIEEIEKEGLTLMHLRKVPVNTDILGKDARDTEPDIKQVFITGCDDQQVLELKLYIIRKRIEKRMAASDIPNRKDFYVASLSTKSIIYKGMLESMQLRHYFPDLTNPYLTSGLALVHSRFSTNTFPTWSLAQPFRLLAHNGEINTIRGNRGWMEARESVLSSPRIPNIDEIRPIIQPDMSDSASLDNVLEFFVASGMSLPHAMAMLVPESFNEKNPISEDLKAFYEYHSILMEPWDGPAALLFSDGRYAGGMLDRNGLRPARYLITKNGMMVGEAVIFFRPECARAAMYERKQLTQLASKMRFIAAQFEAYLQDDLWLQLAAHSNEMANYMASGIRKLDGVTLTCQPQANGLFAVMPREAIERLRKEYFFYDWDEERNEVRWMCSFDTTREDIDRFIAVLKRILSHG